jgi:geranylgeranyl pyrophosphate synthase
MLEPRENRPDFALRRSDLCARIDAMFEALLPVPDAPHARLYRAIRHATIGGGKRLRPLLVLLSGQLFGVPEESALRAGLAVEAIHVHSLIHDDLPCMDDDDLRRGKPTCHRAFDEATALLAGDALQALAFEILAGRDDPRRVDMLRRLSHAIGAYGMAGGQALDLAAVGVSLTPGEVEDMHRRKTGALIHACVMLGAHAAVRPVPAPILEALEHYGWAVGLAFQIIDDVLDVEGETATLGKMSGADRARGKPTYPAVLGLNASKARARELQSAALESLRPLGDNAGALSDLARYIVERDQ